MAGKRGMEMPADTKTLRQNIWRSIRILKRFTIPDLLRTVPDLKYDNAQKFIRRLLDHGYVAKTGNYTGGKAGEYQKYVLRKDNGPVLPMLGIGRSEKFLKKEKEKEKNKETEGTSSEEITDDNDRPDATAA